MSKRKYIKRLSSAAILSMAVYANSVSPVWAKEGFSFKEWRGQKIEKQLDKSVERGVSKLVGKGVVIGRGIVEKIDGKTLEVKNEKGLYLVHAGEETKIQRRFGSKGSLDEIKVGHEISVVGKYGVDGRTIEAKMIRDLSIQLRNGEYWGVVVEAPSADLITIKTKKGELIKVTDFQKAQVLDKNGREMINYTVIKVGDQIKVKGLIDTATMTMSEVVKIKDSSLVTK